MPSSDKAAIQIQSYISLMIDDANYLVQVDLKWHNKKVNSAFGTVSGWNAHVKADFLNIVIRVTKN